MDDIFSRLRVPRDIVRLACAPYADRTALITARGTRTYRELFERTLRLASAWAAAGVGRGDRVLAQVRDGPEQIEIRLAAYESGAVLTAFHEAVAPPLVLEAARLVVAPRLFIYDPAVATATAAALHAAFPEMTMVALGAPYEALLARGAPELSTSAIDPADPAIVAFTSGTTGQPKGLIASHGIGVESLRLTAQNVKFRSGGADTFVIGIPLVAAGSGIILPMVLTGGTLVIPERYDAEEILRLVERHAATRTFVTPSMLIDILDLPGAAGDRLGALRNVIYGTAPMPAARLEEALRRFGPIFQQGYGMAEVLPPVSLLQMEEHVENEAPAPRRVLGSVGRVMSEVRVTIVDERGAPVRDGEIGEVLIASPTMFSGYYGRPELTAESMRGEFFRTSDYGYFDEERLLHVLDRRADLIHREGRVVFPRLVEEAIHDHPAVKEACLVRLGDGGPTVMAVSLRRTWRPKAGDASRELSRFLAERLEAWQRPDEIRLVDEIPRSHLLKPLRREVRERLSPPLG